MTKASVDINITVSPDMEKAAEKDAEKAQSTSLTRRLSTSLDLLSDTSDKAATAPSTIPFWKWQTISTACLVCFAVSLDATAILSASEEVCHDFGIDQTDFPWAMFLLSSWTGAAAVLPLFFYPVMEDFGVRKIYLAVFVAFLGFVAIQAVAPTFAALIIARFFAGAAGGVLQNAVDGIATDVWGPQIHHRAFSITLYVTSLLSGVIGGSIFGGIVELFLHWRWIFYIELIVYSILLLYAYFSLSEPRLSSICTKELSTKSLSATVRLLETWAVLRTTLMRGIRMLFTEFIVGTFTLWTSFAFGTVFMMAASLPQVCTTIYGWSEAQGAIFSTPFLIGAVFGGVACSIQDIFIYPRLTAKRPNPEARLYLAIPGTLLAVVPGIFIYAWTATPSVHWMVLAIALALAGFGVTCIVVAVAIYVTDCYSLHAASAISAVAFGENCFAAFLPLATRDMYTRLGFQWAGTLLGIIAVVLCLPPILLIIFGERIRSRSRYLNEIGRGN